MLEGWHILIVEDEYILAEDLKKRLEDAGAVVLGPEPTIDRALARIAKERRVDVAILDVNLSGVRVFPVADALAARNIPFLFASGYEDQVIRDRFADAVACEKPLNMRRLFVALQSLAGHTRR